MPLRFAEAVNMSEFSVVGLLTYASETMLEAFAQLQRYGRLVTELDLGAEGRLKAEFRDNAPGWSIPARSRTRFLN